MKKPIMAILYDFDKTLCTTDMQNYSFIPSLGMSPEEFWGETGKFSEKTGCERILSYMYMMIKLSKEKGIPLTKKYLNSLGQDIVYYNGVETWFKRINEYGREKGVKVEHYLVSSGTSEIIEGCSIYKEFKDVYGCEFYFDPATGEPLWPKQAINYTQKTQCFFRIAKGLSKEDDDNKVNEKVEGKRIPYENIVYLGDGMTDVPCMLLVKNNNGKSIAIYNRKDRKNMAALLRADRVNYACVADYSKGSDLENTIKLIIDSISVNYILKNKEITLKNREIKNSKAEEK